MAACRSPVDAHLPRSGRIALRLLGLVTILVAVAAGAGFWVMTNRQQAIPTAGGSKPTEPAKPITVGGIELFKGWPKEKPDLVIVVSGQMYGYLSPCGCSRPQLGGLERRYNLIAGLKDLGWEVIGLDVGDIAPHHTPAKRSLPEQDVKKYGFALRALKDMGYIAVGLGKTEFQNNLDQLLGQFTVNHPNERPIVLAANLAGVQLDPNTRQPSGITPREKLYQVPNARPMVEDVELYQGKGVSVGVVGLVGPSVAAEVVEIDRKYDFEKNSVVLPKALEKLGKSKPDLKVLLYQGSDLEARKIAQDYPEIGLIVRASDESEGLPPLFATKVPDTNPTTQIVHVGHKGQYVGVFGVFKTDKGVDLRYQLVPLGEEYLTPEGAAAAEGHKVLELLEQYTAEVKRDDLLAAAVKDRGQHPAQVNHEGLKYIGVQGCVKCHAAEVKKWGETKHSHAYEALEKVAKRPSLRQFDPDCVGCHTTGFYYQTGFESKEKTPDLLHNQCENCHGPGSGHAAKPNDKDYLKLLAPWKLNKDDKLDKALLDGMAKTPEGERGRVNVPAGQRRLVNALQSMCMRCHDQDNDPKFDIWTYMPQVYHSGLGQSDLPPGIGK